MAQQTQPKVSQAQPIAPVQQPAVAQPAQIQPEGEIPIWKNWWLWLIIAIVIIGSSVGFYFLLR